MTLRSAGQPPARPRPPRPRRRLPRQRPRLTEVIAPADWDGTTIEFAGTSGAGLPGGIAYDAATSHGTSPLARLRAGPRYGPPEPAPAGYAATTGPIPVIGRAVSIGDALTHDDAFGPKLAPLPCGHCGTPRPSPRGSWTGPGSSGTSTGSQPGTGGNSTPT